MHGNKKLLEEDKYLCYCSKVTHKKFKHSLISNYEKSLYSICDIISVAKECASCLPNVEDYYFKLKGEKSYLKPLKGQKKYLSIRKKIISELVYLSYPLYLMHIVIIYFVKNNNPY